MHGSQVASLGKKGARPCRPDLAVYATFTIPNLPRISSRPLRGQAGNLTTFCREAMKLLGQLDGQSVLRALRRLSDGRATLYRGCDSLADESQQPLSPRMAPISNIL